jgi:hypothetical protein
MAWERLIMGRSIFYTQSPFSLMEVCSLHPSGAIEAFSKKCRVSIFKGSANPFRTSSEIRLSRMALCFYAD